MENIKQKQKLGAIYVRESTEEQNDGYSPQKQERTIREYAEKNNIKIVELYKDLLSGQNASKRISFQKMIKDAKDKKFHMVLVFHSSRFARNVEEARKYKNLLRNEYGIDVVSVTQQFGDFNKPDAFLNEGINELFDEHYSKQLSFWMKNAFMEKRQQGYCLGNPPLGYIKKKVGYDKNKKRNIYEQEWYINEKEAKVVKQMYKLYATGKNSLQDIAREFNKKGYLTKNGRAFTFSTIKSMLQNRVYLGFVVSKRRDITDMKGNHKPIISKKLYDKVQKSFHERTRTYGRPVSQQRFYLLQGVLYCYNCIHHIKGKENSKNPKFIPRLYCETSVFRNGKEKYFYGCKFRRENKTCMQDNVSCEVYDKQVLEYMKGFKFSEEMINNILRRIEKMFDEAEKDGGDKDRISVLLKKKQRLNYMFVHTNELSEEDYDKEIKSIDLELSQFDSLGSVRNDYKIKKKEAVEIARNFLSNFSEFWESSDITNQNRRDWILLCIKRIWVKDSKIIAIEPRDEFKALFVSTKLVLTRCPVATQESITLILELCFIPQWEL
jgi:site-specific DNA recombinase